ncbi:MAG TPA: response regulator, partial [Sphingobacterium sp.]|nr:response regulator [Sphingobacterium sp.]
NSEKSIDRFYAIAEDPLDGSLWFGSYSTIWRYDPTYGRFEKQDLDGIYTNSGAGCLFFDSKYRLWIGTEYSGLIRVDRDAGTGRWQNVKVYKANGTQAVLPDERVYTVSEDGQGAIWIGTANGLCRLNPDTDEIAGFGTAGGLVNTYITKLLWDPENEDMWFAHKQGLSKISTIDFNIDNYTVKGNTSDYEFMEGAGFRDIQNKLYFGGMDGFITFIPHHIQDNLSQPKLVFTRFSVLNKDIRIGESISGAPILTKDINLTESIRLAYTNNSFSIEFSALHFTDPKRNKYAYKLDGYDGTWVSADATSRSATYTNLPPGNYTFYLKGANSDGIWSEEAKTVKIYILPPWWMTYWAYSGYLILAIVAGYLGLRIVHNRQHLQQKLLAERLQREQVVALEKSKSEFFTQVSHEFRTPLTLILDPLQQLTSQESLSGERRKTYYDIMQRNTGRLLNLVNQLLDFRKIESDNMELVATSDDLLLIVRHCVQGFALQAKQQQVSLIFLTNEQEHFSFGVNRDAVEKIIYNLLSNALKYTPPRGEIRVSVRQDKDEALLQVSNTGEGIALEDINRIFDPFYQIKGNTVFGQNTGSGIGLSLVKSLAHQHGGHVQLTSAPNDSTLFTVTLSALQSPVNDNAVRPDPDKSEWMEEQYIAKKGEELILIVEDVPDIRDYLAMIIRDNGYRVATATNGEKGLDRAREMIPDLILSDIMMPGKDGMAFCFEVKSDERTSHIPVILLTAKQDMVVEKQGYESGADAYIVKPFLSELLMVRIKNLLASRQQLRKLFAGTPAFTVALESIGEKDKAFIHKTMALIEANMGVADLDVIWLAEQLYLSRTQLYRKIKALTDQSVHEFITSVRLKRGAELLVEGQMTVTEIAFAIGYSDTTAFGRNFQKHFGQSPKKYAQNKGQST